jgi:hypothetical protein
MVSPLRCHARAVKSRPRVRTVARIAVHTAARARVTGHADSGLAQVSASGRAGARGWRTLRFRLHGARAGLRVVITVYVSRHARTGTCQASFRPRAAPRPAPVSVPTTPAPTPTTLGPPPSAPAPAGCHPLSNEGTCYKAGEFCRDSDHGKTGVAANGEKIICEDNDGWRWEPA